MRARITGFAYVALLPPAAFAVHQLRYMLAFGGHAGIELQRTGHSYLHSVVPWLVVLLALAVGGFLRALGRGVRGSRRLPARFSLSLTALWMACSAALVAIFVCQEFLEGLFATGHPGGWRGSSATAAGGRSRWRCASACSWQRCCTALAGSCGRSYAGEGVPIWLLPDGSCAWRVPAMLWSSVRRRWSRAGRFGVRREAVEKRCSLAASPWRILPPR